MLADDGLRDRLRHVRWIGGGSGAGKSTIATRLAAERGWRLYSSDETIRAHAARATISEHPLVHAFLAMDMDERWLGRPPTEMLKTFHGFAGEMFEMIVEDVLSLPRSPRILVEGFRLLPRLVKPLLAGPGQAIWLIPTPAFRRFALEDRGTTAAMLAMTSDPVRAFENLLERDRLFTERIDREAADLNLVRSTIDIGMRPEEVRDRARSLLDA